MGDLITLWRWLTGGKATSPDPATDPPAKSSVIGLGATSPPSLPPKVAASAPRTGHNTPHPAPSALRPGGNDPVAPAAPASEAIQETANSNEASREPVRLRVVSHGGHSRFLGDPVASGGTSTVFEVLNAPNLVAKVFDDEHLASFGATTEAKVKALLARRGQQSDSGPIVWPRTAIYRPDGEWIGYSMSRTEGVLLNRMVFPKLQAKYFPQLDRFNVVQILLQIVDGVVALHRANIYVGDFNFENFVVNRSASRVWFIDTDGFQVDEHPCLFVKPEYLPPEHIDQDATTLRRTSTSDSFSLAILLFQALMKMRHPYDTIGGGDLIDNLRNGHFPYGRGGVAPGREGAIPEGPWYVMWSHLPWGLKDAFIQTFTEGAREPRLRPTVEDWRHLLTKYGAELGRGYHDRELLPAQAKTSEYRGKVQPGEQTDERVRKPG